MRLIDADEAFRVLSDYYHHRDDAEIIDAVPVVRCEDCRYYGNPFGLGAGADSERWCYLLGLVGAFDKDDYCSHGERRTDDTR